jgi:hypothetical protein
LHPALAWFTGAAYISYQYGYKCNMLPLPKRYIALTTFISLAGLITMANENAGGLVAWGSLLAMFLYAQQKGPAACDKLKPQSNTQQSDSQAQSGSGLKNPTTRSSHG